MARIDPVSTFHDRSAGLIIRSTRVGELKAAIAAHPDEYVRALFEDVDKSAIAKLVTNSDGSGNVIARGMQIRLTEEEFQRSKNLKIDLNAQFGQDIQFSNLLSTKNPGSPLFWDWAATLSTPLYQQAAPPL